MSDELKIVLEDVKERFDTVMEGIQMINEKLDRHIEGNRKEHEKFEMGLLEFRKISTSTGTAQSFIVEEREKGLLI